MELMQQHRDELHAVFVPVGGGGLIAGIATIWLSCLKR
jgi:threonine dehydratase